MSDRITANGLSMPRLGLGTWGMKGKVCQRSVETGLELGYRHIDTAQMYGNEEDVGAALAATKVPRGDIHLTTKVWNDDLTPSGIRRAFEDSLCKLRTDYVDLYLIHWPSPAMDLRAAMEGMMAVRRDGRARRVGVANFSAAMVRACLDECGAEIAAEQFEYHAMLRQPALLEFLRGRGIPIIAYSPLAKGRLTGDPTLQAIGRKHGATAAQVALAWLLEQPDVTVIPKSSRREGLEENMGALGLRLDDEDRAAIEKLPKDRRCVSPGFAPQWDQTG
ncbi:MAG TPA: aldo/keto reductase [Acetobacteraceae bacterium]|nr:aldo/keto reductase [Acetobacteraceae bacterium]